MNIREQKFYCEIGTRIYFMRKESGRTQEWLAKRIGISRGALANIEQGKQRIYLHMLHQIAKPIECNVKDLLPKKF